MATLVLYKDDIIDPKLIDLGEVEIDVVLYNGPRGAQVIKGPFSEINLKTKQSDSKESVEKKVKKPAATKSSIRQ